MAASDIDIDFEAIGKAFFRTLPKYSNIPDSEIMTPNFRRTKLKVDENDIKWVEDHTNSTGVGAVAEVKPNPNYPLGYGEATVGDFTATQKMDEVSKIVITKGLIADIGRTVKLPLPTTPECVRRVLGRTLEIDPSRAKDQAGDKMTVTQAMENVHLPPEGAKEEIHSKGISYKGKFTCRVFPQGKCLLEKSGSNLDGSNPDIQHVIDTLVKRGNYQHLMSKFGFDRDQSLYFWTMEGFYELKKAPKLSVTKK